MDIDFRNNKLKKCCNERAAGIKEWGAQIATKVFQRLMELRAADNLSEISYLPPPRCHSVNEKRKGCWAVDTVHPMRLLFKINQDPVPKLEDGSVDLKNVTSIIIWEVEDYHGKRK